MIRGTNNSVTLGGYGWQFIACLTIA